MSLNDISLTPQIMAGLYPVHLVEVGNKAQSANEITESIKFLGNNQLNILILVSEDNAAFIDEDELNFLSGVLTACKLSVADTAIINLKNLAPPVNYQVLINQLKSKTILMFGIEAGEIDLPFNFPYFQLQKFDQCTYLSSPTLKEIEKEKALKTQLWTSLKKIFRL